MARELEPSLGVGPKVIALGHVGRDYPNKLDQVLTGDGDLQSPRTLHPIFYGSFDWHSSVHSHWLLARVLRRFPDIEAAGAIRAWLDGAFTAGDLMMIGVLTRLKVSGLLDQHPNLAAYVAREIPLNRLQSAEEIASAICWLLSDAARGVTGEALNVSAGQTMV